MIEFELLLQDIVNSFSFHTSQFAIGVSGGIDSIVLLHLMINWAKRNKYSFPKVLTVDHRLRSDSQKEANFVVSYAKKLGAKESFILASKEQDIKGCIQLNARKVRYKLLTEWCKKNGVQHLFVAHNKNDQAETLLLRLERGSGVDGLSSMYYKSFLSGIHIFRPLLNSNRSEIEKYAYIHKLRWVEDRSNSDLKYRRNLYREFLKTNDNRSLLIDRICLTALHMKRAVRALMYYTRIAFNNCVNICDLGYIEIKLCEFRKLPEEISLRILVYSIMAISYKYYKPRYDSVITIFDKILNKSSDVNCTLSGCKIRKYSESILILRESSKIQEVTVRLPLKHSVRWDNRFVCTILGDQECLVTIAPLKRTQKIPEFLKNYSHYSEVCYSLPMIQKDGEIISYPNFYHNRRNTTDKVQCIINSIVKQNLISFIISS